MNRLLLAAVVGLVLLIAVSRAGGRPTSDDPDSVAVPVAAVGPRPGPPPVAQLPDPAAPLVGPGSQVAARDGRTPIIARMARSEARRRIAWAGEATYLDSLFITPDSTVRRWADGVPIRVWFAPTLVPAQAEATRLALAAWSGIGFGLSLEETGDSTGAEIRVRWVDRFDGGPAEKTGLAEVQSDGLGQIGQATVWLAVADPAGHPLSPDETRGIAMHEIGHALGLLHSGTRGDIMFPTVFQPTLSNRDRSTIMLLYTIPPGPLREPPL